VRALITGASQGIGRATARRLAADGWDVGVHFFRHHKEAEALVTEIHDTGREAFAVGGDLGVRAEVETLAKEVEGHWPSLDALVLNAGPYPRRALAELTEEEFEAILRVHLVGPAMLTRRLLPSIARSGRGRIVFVSSVLAHTGSKQGAHYAAAKAGVIGLAYSLSRELAPGIRVNVVAPGTIDTAILAGDSPAQRADRERQIPLARIGRPEEVADAIAFLVSDRSSYITGATLDVNGGLRTT
jgi:3-oxoacyl-[acyl-carrier protein] reductase